MRKNIEKILAAAGTVIALVLIIILLVTVFGGIEQSEFDNNLVKGLFITLGILYTVLAVGLIAIQFINSDVVKEVTIRSEQGGSCKATGRVIRKLVKASFRDVEGVKTGKTTLIINEYGVKLKVSVGITNRDVYETETYLRTLLEEVFKGALGFRFHAIEFKIVEFQARFKPDQEKIESEVAEKVAAHVPNYAVVPGVIEVSGQDKEQAEGQEEVAVEEVAEEAEQTETKEATGEEVTSEETTEDSVENEDVDSTISTTDVADTTDTEEAAAEEVEEIEE